MGKILLDGKGIYEASIIVDKMKQKKEISLNKYERDTLSNIIMAIMLWDEICIFPETCSSIFFEGVKYFNQYKNRLITIEPIDKPLNFMLDDDTRRLKQEYFFPQEKGLYELYRALDYYFAANLNGIDYMPSLERQTLLQEYNYTGFFQRKEVVKKIDEELLCYYNRVNSKLPVKFIKYTMPVLLDYVIDRGSKDNLLENAFELRESSIVSNFRKEMNQLDAAWLSGDVKYVDEYFSYVESEMKKIEGIVKTEKKITITISFPPSLSFDLNIKHRKKFHSIFLKDITLYGIHNRRNHDVI